MPRARRWGRKQLWLLGGAIATVVALVTTYIVVFALPRYGEFEQRIEARCSPLVVIAFRGSGEGNLDPDVTANAGAPHRYGDTRLVTNGWEGVTLDGLFEALSTTVVDDFQADQIPVVPIGPAGEDEPFGYDAIPAAFEASTIESALTYPSSRLLHSASRGAEAATHLMTQYLRDAEGCPVEPRFLAVGYSQGAMAARHTAELNPEQVIGVVSIGDPYQLPDAPGVRDEGASGIGIIRWKAGDDHGRALDAFYDMARELHSAVCHADDPICDFSPLEGLVKLALGDYGTHLDYYSDERPGEAAEDARRIAEVAAERWQLALEALRAGEATAGDCTGAASAAPVVRTASFAIAGVPTLVAVTSAERLCPDASYEFDLDGDGVFETRSTTGTVWADVDEAGPRDIAARVVDPQGTTGPTGRTTAPISPQGAGDILVDDEGNLIDPPSTPAQPAVEEPAPAVPPRRTNPVPPAQPPATEPPTTQPPPTTNQPDPNAPGPNDPNQPDPNDPDPNDPYANRGTLTMAPDPAYPTSFVSLRGSGYPPEVVVVVTVDGVLPTQVMQTDELGEWELEFIVSQIQQPGTYQVHVENGEGATELFADVFDVEIVPLTID